MNAKQIKTLPTVTWKGRKITRLILGHNPIKGGSHFSEEMNADMKQWHSEQQKGLELLKRSEECGINTIQCGGDDMQRLIARHKEQGGKLNWLATLYGNESGILGFGNKIPFDVELKAIMSVNPKPIGIQHFGECTDRLFLENRFSEAKEHMKRLRDTGLPIGICSHLPEVAEEVASQGWDIDFFQLSLYTAYAGTRRKGVDRTHEIFDDPDRDRMLGVIEKLDKPCIAFKILGANRKCGSDSDIEAAFKYAFSKIKPSDVVCVGMWQKYRDQVQHNTSIVRKILET
jgi:hypothetical protein